MGLACVSCLRVGCVFAASLRQGCDAAGYFGRGYASPYVWVPAVVGGVALVLGITLLLASSPTTVTFTNASRTADARPPRTWREPTWRTDDVAFPRPAVTNIIDVRF